MTHDSRHRMASMAASQIVEPARGGRPLQLVNPDMWLRYAKRFERVLWRTVAPA